ncbi:hypothetical protein [Nostoc sp. TCL26-01]|uniref:hypothetical protein n=1 Tax=Nostoc sp. TCL26-01 TaxID=2576904 RepID=UPI0015BFBE8F|nr:hypothetical protein [Nostoc sp. TCL26-01]
MMLEKLLLAAILTLTLSLFTQVKWSSFDTFKKMNFQEKSPEVAVLTRLVGNLEN